MHHDVSTQLVRKLSHDDQSFRLLWKELFGLKLIDFRLKFTRFVKSQIFLIPWSSVLSQSPHNLESEFSFRPLDSANHFLLRVIVKTRIAEFLAVACSVLDLHELNRHSEFHVIEWVSIKVFLGRISPILQTLSIGVLQSSIGILGIRYLEKRANLVNDFVGKCYLFLVQNRNTEHDWKGHELNDLD